MKHNNTYENLTQEAQDEIKEQAIETLNYFDGYGCDLHNEAFNVGYFIIGTYKAEQWLHDNIGVFNAIKAIKEYEEFNCGAVNTDLSSSEEIVNMLVYIAGEELLNESGTLHDKWNDRLEPENIKQIIEEIREL